MTEDYDAPRKKRRSPGYAHHPRPKNPNEGIVTLLKKQVLTELESGNREVVLDVSGLVRRDRGRVRMCANRWLRTNQWRGATHFDADTMTLTVRVLQRIEVQEVSEPPEVG